MSQEIYNILAGGLTCVSVPNHKNNKMRRPKKSGGDYAASAGSPEFPTNPGYQMLNLPCSSSFRTQVRTCNSRWAPRRLHLTHGNEVNLWSIVHKLTPLPWVYNGYYTLPRLGYDGKLKREWMEKAPKRLKDSKTIQELFSKQGGPEWWKRHGRSFEAFIEL